MRNYITGIALIFLSCTLPVQAQTWRPVGAGILNGISGIAIIEQTEAKTTFIIVHDNKNHNQPRAATVTIKGDNQPEYNQLDWQSEIPIDLEGITTIPNHPHQFLALTSGGQVYHIQLVDSEKAIAVLKVFNLPEIPQGNNFEGLAVQKINGILLMAWAHRGSDQEPAILYWAELDLANYNFLKPIHSVSLTMPRPLKDVRHISDIKIDSSGAVFVTSTSDSGNDGPFVSAVYVVGSFYVQPEKITFTPSNTPIPILRFNYHKIEALELLPGAQGGLVFGTDDENFGSSIYLTSD